MQVRPLATRDRPWLTRLLEEEVTSPVIATRGRFHDGLELPGLVAEDHAGPSAVILYRLENEECEIVFMAASRPGAGAGSALLDAAADLARSHGCKRLWLITTNDNVDGLRFYQRRGWDMAGFYRDAVGEARTQKPGIPEFGCHGIPIRHELELELLL